VKGGRRRHGLALLGEIIKDWRAYELDDEIYVPIEAEPALDAPVNVLHFDRARKRVFEGQRYLLGIEQVRDAIEGLEGQLGRPASPVERLRAVLHFARHDAFIDPLQAVDG
jgi:hypothetical protein